MNKNIKFFSYKSTSISGNTSRFVREEFYICLVNFQIFFCYLQEWTYLFLSKSFITDVFLDANTVTYYNSDEISTLGANVFKIYTNGIPKLTCYIIQLALYANEK